MPDGAQEAAPEERDPFIHSVQMELNLSLEGPELTPLVDSISRQLGSLGHRSVTDKHLRVILLNCARLLKYADGYYVAYSRNNSYCHPEPNPHRIDNRKIKAIIERMIQLGMVDHRLGFRGPIGTARMSRFRPSSSLTTLIRDSGLLNVDHRGRQQNEGLILKDAQGRKVSFEPSSSIREMQTDLDDYNNFIRRRIISVGVDCDATGLMLDRTNSYRVFNEESFSKGGRYFGPWWSMCPSNVRRYILIDGQRTVELDYTAHHLNIVYSNAGSEMAQAHRPNPYYLEGVPRDVVKTMFTCLTNTTSIYHCWLAFCNGVEEFKPAARVEAEPYLARQAFESVVSAFRLKHPAIWSNLPAKRGLTLMRQESEITAFIYKEMMILNKPCLGVHDSFIVKETDEGELRDLMHQAYSVHLGDQAIPHIKRKTSLQS